MGLRDDIEDEEDFNERRDLLLDELREQKIGGSKHEQAMTYFEDFTTTLFKYCVKPSLDNQWVEVNFQTNRSEAINNVLKIATDWRPKPLPKLIKILKSYEQHQATQIRRALYKVCMPLPGLTLSRNNQSKIF